MARIVHGRVGRCLVDHRHHRLMRVHLLKWVRPLKDAREKRKRKRNWVISRNDLDGSYVLGLDGLTLA